MKFRTSVTDRSRTVLAVPTAASTIDAEPLRAEEAGIGAAVEGAVAMDPAGAEADICERSTDICRYPYPFDYMEKKTACWLC